MKYRQYKIRHFDTKEIMVAWLDHPRMQPGDTFTIKDDAIEGHWTVVERYGLSDKADLYKPWRVGGIV